MHKGVHFRAESPKHLLYQHTPECNGERNLDRVFLLLLLLLLLLHKPVACKAESCLFKLATSAFSSPKSVTCGAATVAIDYDVAAFINAPLTALCCIIFTLSLLAGVNITTC